MIGVMVISLDKLDYSIYLGYIIFKIFTDLPIFLCAVPDLGQTRP
jgi:hypothetical protein